MAGNARGSGELRLNVALYQAQGPDKRPMWIARSIPTGHLAHGRTPESATERLIALIRGMLRVAVSEYGQTAQQWWDSQQRDSSHWASAFQSKADEGAIEKLPEETVADGNRLLPCRVVLAGTPG